jgi:hypothetical protein
MHFNGNKPNKTGHRTSLTESVLDDQLITDQELAKRWSCSPKTLRNQRSQGQGCPYVRLGRMVRYRLSDVVAFEAQGSGR